MSTIGKQAPAPANRTFDSGTAPPTRSGDGEAAPDRRSLRSLALRAAHSPLVHPLLFALFPLLFLFAYNVDQSQAIDLFRPALLVLPSAIALFFAFALALRDHRKAGLLASWFAILFFSYGHVRSVTGGVAPFGVDLRLDRNLLPLWGLAFLVVCWLVIRVKSALVKPTVVLNGIAVFLVALQIPPSVIGLVNRPDAGSLPPLSPLSSQADAPTGTLPDIYYIILDGYARADVLLDFYDYDNTPFLEALTDRGFFVAGRSHSNYSQTHLSLASSLNLTRVDPIVEGLEAGSTDRRPLAAVIKKSRAVQFLSDVGYSTVAFSSGCTETEMRDADLYLAPGLGLSEFSHHLLNSTPIPGLLRLTRERSLQYDLHRNRILFTLERLGAEAPARSPAFVFAHLLSPHPPFVFSEEGDPIEPNRSYTFADGPGYIMEEGKGNEEERRRRYVEGYRDQLAFLNGRVLAAVDRILAVSERPPAIVLHGDHGPASRTTWDDIRGVSLRERMSILYAVYLPDGDYADIDDAITPVNTFALVFNRLFDAGIERIEDRSYFSTWVDPYRFIDVTDRLRADESFTSPTAQPGP